MGVNYYWHLRPCDHCGRHDPIHVGKYSTGWSFLFRAWPHQLAAPAYPEWGHDPASPFGVPVMSRTDWRTVLTTTPGRLVDDWGTVIDDPAAWIDGLTPPDAAQQRWEDEERPPGPHQHRDTEGFRFYATDFC